MNLKNIIYITDECGISGGGPKVQILEANTLCEKYNVIYFCGFVTDSTVLNEKVKLVSVYNCSFLKMKNKLLGSLRCLYSKKAKKVLKELLKNYSKHDTVIHIGGFYTGLSSSIFSVIYSSQIPTFFTLHSYHLACPNGGFFNYKSGLICSLKPLGCKCLLSQCDSRNILFKYYRIIRQKIQNHNVRIKNNNLHYIFLSNLSKKILFPLLKPSVSYRMIHNPIETRNALINNISNNKYYLFIGRVQREKGIELLCEYADKKGIALMIVGDGNLSSTLKKKYHDNNKITFCGWKKYDEINKIMLGARALIFPSLWYECEPLTVLEAKSVGLPLLISNICASVEDVTKYSGCTYNPLDYDDFSRKIDIFEDNNSIELFSKKSYDEFNDFIKNNNHTLEVEKFYIDVLNGCD